ncbi:MAG: extracellular solute-binding protein [Clostridia bacterium]|nr:extracellular solute-binding protein [Clostridia bacterium]
MDFKFKKMLALMVAFVMLLACITGCKNNPTDAGSDEWIESEIVIVQGDDTNTNDDKQSSSDDKTTSGDKQQTTSSGTSSTGKDTVSSGKVDISKYRGTTVKYATWKDPDQNEDGPVIKAFEKKYGINVEIVNVPQGEYVNKIVSLIASEKAPDVFIETAEFPNSLAIAQPVTAMGIDMKDPIWDQNIFKQTTVNGKVYGLGVLGSIWTEADCVVFNKKLMQDNSITTPAEYYKAGKWNLDTLEKVLKDCKNAGFAGGYVYPESLAASFNADWIKLENGTFKSNVSNRKLTEIYERIAKWNKEGLLVPADSYFSDGRTGLSIGNAFALKKTGTFAGMNQNHIGFTYMPDYDASTKATPSGITRFYGVCKGAQNPMAAGVFLRYYLDTANYDVNEAFFSTEAATFFFEVTTAAAKNKISYYLNGASKVCGFNRTDYSKIAYEEPDQVATLIKAKQNAVEGYVNTLNSYVSKNTK